MTFLVNLMFGRIDKFDGPIFGGRAYMRGGELIFEMLIGLHIWGANVIYGGRINGILRYHIY